MDEPLPVTSAYEDLRTELNNEIALLRKLVNRLTANNLTLFGENIDLIRQRDDARDIAVRSGYFTNPTDQVWE